MALPLQGLGLEDYVPEGFWVQTLHPFRRRVLPDS
jgi:hypothetical protein